MKEFKGTTGEWVADDGNIQDNEDGIIASLYSAEFGNWKSDNETEANAQLMAAAPELLNACILILEQINNQTTLVRVDLLENAINKALK